MIETAENNIQRTPSREIEQGTTIMVLANRSTLDVRTLLDERGTGTDIWFDWIVEGDERVWLDLFDFEEDEARAWRASYQEGKVDVDVYVVDLEALTATRVHTNDSRRLPHSFALVARWWLRLQGVKDIASFTKLVRKAEREWQG